jgi:hypothetical protein
MSIPVGWKCNTNVRDENCNIILAAHWKRRDHCRIPDGRII